MENVEKNVRVIDTNLLDQLKMEAEQSPRLRMNYNFHDSEVSKAQRLLNALEPETVMPIHRHSFTSETYFVIRGSLNVLLYNADGVLIEKCELNPLKGTYGVDIPARQWHSIEVLESGTVIFEVKDGPYCPLNDKDILEM